MVGTDTKENSQYLLRNAVTDYSVVGYTGVSSWVKALDRAELDKEKDACSGTTGVWKGSLSEELLPRGLYAPVFSSVVLSNHFPVPFP